MNGFVMDMNNGKDYTKHIDWKCKYFDPKVSSVVPSNWMNYDYDDSEWEMAVSYGMNYQNNSYQIFEHERDGIHLNAEWLWTGVISNPNIYCRKKNVDNELYYVETKPMTTSAPSQTIHEENISQMHTTPPQSKEVLQVSHTSQTYEPVVSHIPTTFATDKPVVSSTPTPVEPHKPVVSHPTTPIVTDKPDVSSTHTTFKTHIPIVSHTTTPVATHKPVVSNTPTHVAPHKTNVSPTPTSVSTHKPVVSPHKPVVSPSPPPVVTHKPIVSPSPTPVATPTISKSKNNIIINQHITYIIQKFKYTQKSSYSHIENLIRNIKYINQNPDLHKNLIYTRNHLHHHYNTIFKELYRLLNKYDTNNKVNFPDNEDDAYDDSYDEGAYDNDDDDQYKIPPFIESMKKLDKYIQKIEKSIQFIKGKYKNIFINILNKLKLLYREDTIKLLKYSENGFN
jgi:hypothetical protein